MNAWVLIIGDILMFLLFALMGKSEHHTGTAFSAIVQTAAPFVVGWLVVSLLLRTLRLENYNRWSTAMKSTLLTWVLGVPLGLMLRSIYLYRTIWEVPVPFIIVAMTSTLILMVVWRSIFVWLKKRAG